MTRVGKATASSSLRASEAAREAAEEAFRHAIDDEPTRVVVIGGGAAGLVAARDLARPGFDVTVLEERDELGGSVARHEVAGIVLDAGAESFATRGGHIAQLIDDLHLTEQVVAPLKAGAWLQLPDRAVPAPAGLLGIPSSPLATDVIAAIGWGGAFRAYLDRLMPVLKIGEERNLGRLVRRRMGAAVLDGLVAPVTTGVYSASPDDIDVAAAAPGLSQAITRTGSLSGGVAALRASAKAGSAVGGLVGGMSSLVDALAEDAVTRGARLRTGATVVALRPADAEGTALAHSVDAAFAAEGNEPGSGVRPGSWRVHLAGGETLEADAVLLAVPAQAALRLMGQASDSLAQLAGLDWPEATTVDIVTLVVDDDRLDAAPRGTGMLVAETVPVAKVAAKALTHMTAKWSWLAQRLPAGRHVLRLSYGRAGSPSPLQGLEDAGIRLRAIADASTLLNIPLAESSVVGSDAVQWRNAPPAAAMGQRERIDRVRRSVEAVEGLEVTGSWLAGTGLASVVPDARRSSERIRALRWKSLTDKN